MKNFINKALIFLNVNRYWIGVFFASSLFFFLTPMTGDDLSFFGHRSDLNSLADVASFMEVTYRQINGRILGNISTLLLAHGYVLSSFYRAAVLTGLLIFGARLINVSKTWHKNLLVLSIVAMPAPIFAQAIVWRSGFYIYLTPLLLMLIILNFVKDNFFQDKVKLKPLKALTIISLTFIACLFVETVTISLLFISSALLLLGSIGKFSQFNRQLSVLFLVGAILGSMTMFSSPVYRNVINDTDTYRSIGVRDKDKKEGNELMQNAYRLSKLAISDNKTITGLMAIVALAILSKYHAKKRSDSKHLAVGAYVFAASIYFMLSGSTTFRDLIVPANRTLSLTIATIHILVVVLYVLAYLYLLVKSVDRKSRNLVKLTVSLVALLGLPAIFVTPFGARNVFSVYLLITLLSLLVLFRIIDSQKVSYDRIMNYVSTFSLLIIAFLIFSMFSVIGINRTNNNKILTTQIAKGSKTITLKRYVFTSYIHAEHDPFRINNAIAGRCDSKTTPGSRALCFLVDIKFVQ